MAKHHRQWQPTLKRTEFYRGWVFFALYFFVFPFLVSGLRWILDERLGWYVTDAWANSLYYSCAAVVILLLLWEFLKSSFDILMDWLPENIFAVVTGLVGCLVLSVLAALVPLPVKNPAGLLYPQQFAMARGATVFLLVVLWPIIEETLFRGLLFGGIRRYSRPLAYVLSCVAFAFFKVWQFAFTPGAVDLRYLLVGIVYLPMGLALSWCYDKGQSIWSCALLHGILSAIGLALMVC